MGVSTTLFGGGIQINFDTPVISNSPADEDVNVSVGILSKYTAISYNTELSRGSVNLGLGVGLPVINFSTSTNNFYRGVYNRGKQAVNAYNNWINNP